MRQAAEALEMAEVVTSYEVPVSGENSHEILLNAQVPSGGILILVCCAKTRAPPLQFAMR